MKRTILTVLSLLLLYPLVAQEPITIQDETFMLDTNFTHRRDYMILASDSIVLEHGFSRDSHGSLYTFPRHFSTELMVDNMQVIPPSQGQEGGPNEGDTGYVGALGGTIDVSSLGGVSYSIPIELPSGINGMQPSLALTYNSQGGNGLLGWKWDLSGLSSITRTGKTRYHDGEVGGVTINDNNDRFLLDGQRLIPIEDYGDSCDYKTEQDGLARIRAYKVRNIHVVDGHTFVFEHIQNFKVWNTDGTILEYGFTDDSRIDPQNGGNKALCWLLNKISDRYGNSVTYHYEVIQKSGEFYISHIDYTENEKLSIKAQFTVQFEYLKGKIDYEFGFVANNIVQQTRLLSSIIVKNQNGIELQRDSLEYSETTLYANSHYPKNKIYHRLQSVLLKKDGMCLNPTRILWEKEENEYYQYNSFQLYDLDTANFNNFIFVGDFNADGFSDVLTVPYKEGESYPNPIDMNVLINNGNATFQLSPTLSMNHSNGRPVDAHLDWIHVIDINDDGYDDIIMQFQYLDAFSNISQLMIYINNEGQEFLPSWNEPIAVPDFGLYLTIGDFFGEGKQSVVAFGTFHDNHTPLFLPLLYIHAKNGTCRYETIAEPLFYRANDCVTGDFDGDGKTEIMVVSERNAWLYDLRRENGNVVFHSLRNCPEITYVPELNLFPGDFNGDGKDDLLCYGKAYSNEELDWFFLFSKGTAFQKYSTFIFRNYQMAPSEKIYTYSLAKVNEYSEFAMHTSDFDGDGLCDIALSLNRGNNRQLFVYNKFVYSTLKYITDGPYSQTILAGGMHPLGFSCANQINARSQYIHVGNFLGKDNMSFLGNDISGGNASQQQPKLLSLFSQNEYNSVTSITDGLGNIQRFTYGYPTICGSPRTDIGDGLYTANAPLRVLKTATSYKMHEAALSTHYSFEASAFHKDGHGYLGFLKQETIRKANGENVDKVAASFETETMGSHAFSLPKEETAYVFRNEQWLLSSKKDYTFRKVVSSREAKIVKPALVRQLTTNYDIDNPNSLGQCLRKEITEYDYSIGADNTYFNSYNCIETRIGVDGNNVADYNQCEFRARETTEFFPDSYPSWVINRPHKKTIIKSRTGKPDVNRSWWYEYAHNSYQITRIYDIPTLHRDLDPLMTQTDFEYYPEGNLKKQTLKAPRGEHGEQMKTVEYEYGPGEENENQHRLVVKQTASSGDLTYETGYTYDAYDQIATQTGSNGLVTTFESDGLGIFSKTINPDGTQIGAALRWVQSNDNYAPKDALYLKWSRASDNYKALTYYGKTGDELRSVSFGLDGEAIFVDKLYDSKGRLSAVSNPYMDGEILQWTTYEYDNLDRPTTTITPDSTATSITYLGNQTRTTITPTEGIPQSSCSTVNAMGWTVRNDDASGNSFVTYDHLADGLLASAKVNDDATTVISATYDNARNRLTLTDPNYGTLTTVYNAYGEMKKRVSPKELDAGKETTYDYDGMGRLVRETNGMENTSTHYIFNENTGPLKGTLGQMLHKTLEGQTIQNMSYEYDELARTTKTVEQRPNMSYVTTMEYDDCSRISRILYPTNVALRYGYCHGQLQSIYDDDYNLLWRTDKTNAFGQLVDATLGNGSTTHRAYQPEMHYIDSIVTSNNLQDLSFDYDKFGNLASRKDNLRNLEETFHYDKMNRLTDIYNGTLHSQIVYDPLGRMTDKQADGQVVFGNANFAALQGQAARPHAMKSAETAEGVFPSAQQQITYTGFDKVRSILEDGNGIIITYGHDQQRIQSYLMTSDNRYLNKDYVGVCEYNTEYFTDGSASQTTLTYLVGPYGVFAVVENYNNTISTHYILKDHLGSWTTITDSEGHVEQEVSFDAWGNLRDPETWLNYPTDEPTVALMFDRGFTGHEHMTTFGLINMNGRCYDPLTSSFLSVDAYVQDPTNAQGFNRYAYCSHNPLRYTDPTGWYQQTGSGYNINPKANLIGTTTYQSDDPCDMLWGRSVHPCKDGDPDGTIITSSGFMIGNSFVTSCNGPLGQLQAIMNYINSPGEYTAMILQAMNIDMTAGFTCGSYQGMEGFRLSNYSWTDASGQSYHADVFEYIGGDFNGHYITGNEPAARFRNENYNGVPNAFDYGISYAGVVTSFIKDKWENPGSRAQKAINQKKAYNTQKALKAKGITKSVKDIKATKIANLRTGGNALAGLSIGIETLDMAQSRSCNVSNAIGVLAAIGGAFFWEVSLAYMTIETGSYLITGQSFGENIDNWIGKPIFSW